MSEDLYTPGMMNAGSVDADFLAARHDVRGNPDLEIDLGEINEDGMWSGIRDSLEVML